MIHLEVVVENTADLLAPEAYGAGALLRWESSATVDGVYVEGGTEPLVTLVSLYDIWDAAGTAGTWYRTRISDAGATTFSAYSTPFQTAIHRLYLSTDQYRAFDPVPQLSDPALLILLDAAAEAIAQAAGDPGERTDLLGPVSGDLLPLPRSALSVTAVIEDVRWAALALAADDYELSASGSVLRRLFDGTNPRRYWYGRTSVKYLPRDDTAERQRVQRALVQLDLAYMPGLASQTIGTWSETYQGGSSMSYAEQRAAILASLGESVGIY